MSDVVGVDGCAGGWIAAWTSPSHSERIETAVYPTIDALWETHSSADRILVDIPIGLPEHGQRECDVQARSLLGTRGVSVFPAPIRPVVEAAADGSISYEEANELSQTEADTGLQKQVWNIAPKIAEVDTLCRTIAGARETIAECHPELAFAALNGWFPIALSKSTDRGRRARLFVVDSHLSEANTAYERTIDRTYRKDVARDDIVDSLCLLAAGSYEQRSVPADPPIDAAGLPMQIVHPDKAPAWAHE
ncbi:DUF429 domain-containing protein [Halalkalirubrum salinum]|uniref:DUF429 domain-containing protein n=1 Tax=Halalkalirubrum salinum TaxID=2563889 RepID=UPI0010FBA79B|nr:DUF429 domain-containing protein [Halalkalirubrum salinum]